MEEEKKIPLPDETMEPQEYESYVKEVTPTHNTPLNMLKAFFTGGVICTIAQGILNLFKSGGMDKDSASAWTLLILIGAAIILTGFNIFPKIVTFGGAGALVPITGFANSVVAPAIEYKKEGQVFGIGCKIFTIAGPVILYGIFTSWIMGILYCLCSWLGIYWA